jgi:hypothetical protein
MKNYNYRPNFKSVLVKGRVCYENGEPTPNAKVILEALLPHKQDGCEVKYNKKYCGNTVTNYNGEFCCLIYNTQCYYKLKVIKNIVLKEEDINMDIENFNVYLG